MYISDLVRKMSIMKVLFREAGRSCKGRGYKGPRGTGSALLEQRSYAPPPPAPPQLGSCRYSQLQHMHMILTCCTSCQKNEWNGAKWLLSSSHMQQACTVMLSKSAVLNNGHLAAASCRPIRILTYTHMCNRILISHLLHWYATVHGLVCMHSVTPKKMVAGSLHVEASKCRSSRQRHTVLSLPW